MVERVMTMVSVDLNDGEWSMAMPIRTMMEMVMVNW